MAKAVPGFAVCSIIEALRPERKASHEEKKVAPNGTARDASRSPKAGRRLFVRAISHIRDFPAVQRAAPGTSSALRSLAPSPRERETITETHTEGPHPRKKRSREYGKWDGRE